LSGNKGRSQTQAHLAASGGGTLPLFAKNERHPSVSMSLSFNQARQTHERRSAAGILVP
jgi:hypothetical protein